MAERFTFNERVVGSNPIALICPDLYEKVLLYLKLDLL